MGTQVRISPEEYLRTSYENPEPEYVNGELLQRATPNKSHAKLLVRIALAFGELGRRAPIFTFADMRVKVLTGEYRIPDLCIYVGQEPAEEVPATPPFLTVEIASPTDRYGDIIDKMILFKNWGVQHVWFVDPGHKGLAVYDDSGFHYVREFSLPEFEFTLKPADIF